MEKSGAAATRAVKYGTRGRPRPRLLVGEGLPDVLAHKLPREDLRGAAEPPPTAVGGSEHLQGERRAERGDVVVAQLLDAVRLGAEEAVVLVVSRGGADGEGGVVGHRGGEDGEGRGGDALAAAGDVREALWCGGRVVFNRWFEARGGPPRRGLDRSETNGGRRKVGRAGPPGAPRGRPGCTHRPSR